MYLLAKKVDFARYVTFNSQLSCGEQQRLPLFDKEFPLEGRVSVYI